MTLLSPSFHVNFLTLQGISAWKLCHLESWICYNSWRDSLGFSGGAIVVCELVKWYGALSQRYIDPIAQGKCVCHQLDYVGNFPDSTTFSHSLIFLSNPATGSVKPPVAFLAEFSFGLLAHGHYALFFEMSSLSYEMVNFSWEK